MALDRMARRPRIDYPGAWHHVMNRTARREKIFEDDEHVGVFLAGLKNVVDRFEIEVHAFAVMPNHYHVLLRSVRANLSPAMKYLGGWFTQEINRLRRWDGPVFRGRFRSELIENDIYLLTVAAYIHLNPVRAGLARRLDQRSWTSHRCYLGLDTPPQWLSWEYVTDAAGGAAAFADLVSNLRTGAERWPDGFDLETGMGRAKADGDRDGHLDMHDRKGIPSLPPNLVLREVSEITGATKSELNRGIRGPRGNPARRFAVWALSRDTTLTQGEVGALLGMGANHVAHTLRQVATRPAACVGQWMETWERRRANRNRTVAAQVDGLATQP